MACEKAIDFSKDLFVCLGTYEGDRTVEEEYFHMICWRSHFEEKARQKAMVVVNGMQERMQPIAKQMMDKLKGAIDERNGSAPEEKEVLETLPKITLPKDQAKEEWKKYCQVLKTRKDKFLKVMKDAHYQMSQGHELIDIYKIMNEVGLNENNQPRLAIARADLSVVFFEKRDTGAGRFGTQEQWNSVTASAKDIIELPQKTFDVHWERVDPKQPQSWNIKNKIIKTKVPIVPLELLPEGSLENYYILWEAKVWEDLPETKDPLLLKRISENLFAILGCWNLTDLEQSILRGRS